MFIFMCIKIGETYIRIKTQKITYSKQEHQDPKIA